MRLELEKLTSEWNLLYRAVLDHARRLQYEIEQNENLELVNLEGEPLDEIVNVKRLV